MRPRWLEGIGSLWGRGIGAGVCRSGLARVRSRGVIGIEG